MRMNNLMMMLALGACCSTGAAETIAYWRFGDQGLNDSSGNGHALVNSNVDIDSTGAAIFNGTNAWLETAETLDLSGYNKLTVECWMKPEVPERDFGPLLLSYQSLNSVSQPGSFVTYFGKGEKSFRSQLRDSSDKWTITIVQSGSGVPYQSAWHHVALVMDVSGGETWSGKSKLYIDGVCQTGSDSAQSTTIRNFLNLKFVIGGGGEYVPGNFFKGMIDDVRISTGCLAPEEFLKFPTFGRKQSPENPAFAYWPFGRSGLADVTGNGWDFLNQHGGVSCANDHAYFSGSGSGLMINKAFDVNPFSRSGLTYEFFFKTTADKGNDFTMLLENSASYSGGQGRLHARLYEGENSLLNVSLRTKGGAEGYNTHRTDPAGADASAIDGTWHHVALIYDPKATPTPRFDVYFDGRVVPAQDGASVNFSDLAGDCSLFVGCRNSTGNLFKGEMDDVRVMPWALKPEEFLKERSADKPVAHWKFDNPDTAFTDLSGNGHTLVNMNGVTFENGYAVFNGQNAHLKTADTIDLSQDSQMTIEGRFYFEETSDLGVLFGSGDANTVCGFVVYGYLNSLYSQFRVVEKSTWNQWIWDGFAGAKGSWHHVAFVVNLDNRDENQSQMWVDGVLTTVKGRKFTSDAKVLHNDFLGIGGGGSYADSTWKSNRTSFKGRVSELMVTPQELTPENFRLLKTPNPGEVIVRPLAVPTESAALDLTGKTDVTVECFVKFPVEGAAGELFAFAPEGAPQFQLAAADGVLKAKVVPGTGGINAETATVPTDGDWHHVAMVVDGYAAGTSRVRLYVDGVRSATHVERVNWSVPFTAGTFEVGSGFNAKISSVRVTTGVVAPEEFLSERLKAGLTVVFR